MASLSPMYFSYSLNCIIVMAPVGESLGSYLIILNNIQRPPVQPAGLNILLSIIFMCGCCLGCVCLVCKCVMCVCVYVCMWCANMWVCVCVSVCGWGGVYEASFIKKMWLLKRAQCVIYFMHTQKHPYRIVQNRYIMQLNTLSLFMNKKVIAYPGPHHF